MIRSAFDLARDLASRWFRFRVVAGQLRISPGDKLTQVDKALIRQHRDALIALCALYPEPRDAPRLRFFAFDPAEVFQGRPPVTADTRRTA